MISKKAIISINKDLEKAESRLIKLLIKVEKRLIDADQLTPIGQTMYLTDVRTKVEIALGTITDATAKNNKFIDKRKFNPDYDPRDSWEIE